MWQLFHYSIIRTKNTAEKAKSRKFFSNICGFQGAETFVSYYPKKNKVVVLLSILHNDIGIESSGENKLEKKNQYYNYTKSGADTMEQTVRYFNTS